MKHVLCLLGMSMLIGSLYSCKKTENTEKAKYFYQGDAFTVRDTTINNTCSSITDTATATVSMTIAANKVSFDMMYNNRKLEEHEFMKSEDGRYAIIDAFYHTKITITQDSLYYEKQSTPFLGNCRNFTRKMSLARH